MLRAGDGGVAINHGFHLCFQGSWPLGRRHQKIQTRLKIVLLRDGGAAPRFAPGSSGPPSWRLAAVRCLRRLWRQRLNAVRCERFKRNDVGLRAFVEAESLWYR